MLTVSGGRFASIGVALVHAATWLTAIIMIGAWGNTELHARDANDNHVAGETMRMFSWAYFICVLATPIIVVLHSAFINPGDDIISALASMVLLFIILLDNVFGAVYLGYAFTLSGSVVNVFGTLYEAAITIQIFVSLGSAMVLSFYVSSMTSSKNMMKL